MLELLYKRALVAAKAWASHYPKRFKINNEGKGDIIITRPSKITHKEPWVGLASLALYGGVMHY